MPELWLRKTFPGMVFVNTGLPQERLRVAKCQEELEGLDGDSTDIFNSNIIERYSDRPNFLRQLCLAELAAYYYKDYKADPNGNNDVQPVVLSDELVESHYFENSDLIFPQKIKLVNRNEIMNCRKVKAVIRFHTPNRTKEPLRKILPSFANALLALRKGTELAGSDQSFPAEYFESSVKTVVDSNRQKFEPNAEAISVALQAFSENPVRHLFSYDALNDQENDDFTSQVRDSEDDDQCHQNSDEQLLTVAETCETSNRIACYNQPTAITDESLRQSVRSLNEKQRFTYDFVLRWCRNMVKNIDCLAQKTVEPLHIFITGIAGSGKKNTLSYCSQHLQICYSKSWVTRSSFNGTDGRSGRERVW